MAQARQLKVASPVRSDGVRRALQTSSAIERPTSQAMNRRMKLNDALGKLTSAASKSGG